MACGKAVRDRFDLKPHFACSQHKAVWLRASIGHILTLAHKYKRSMDGV